MRLLHTSDWHLGLDFYGADLTADQAHMLEEIACIAEKERVSAVLVAGDVFDRAVVGQEAIALYNDAMRRLCLELRVPVILCAGNHDGAARLSSLSDLLSVAGLHIFGRVTAQDAQVDLGEAVVHVLPYVTADDVRVAYPEQRERISSAADAMAVALEMRVPPRDGRRHILMAHCFAAGGRPGQSDRAAAVGGALAVPTDCFAGYDYVALGHLHRAQTLAGGRVRYSGTPLCTSFAEVGQPKSVTILDTGDLSTREVPLYPLHEVREVRGTLEALLTQPSEDYLHLTVTDEYATALVQEQLRVVCPNALLIDSGLQQSVGDAPMLTMEEAVRDTPLDVAEKFYLYKTGMEMNDEQRGWFLKAIEDAERGD